MEAFTKKQVVDISKLPPRLVQFYTEEGVVTPEVDEGKGRGHVRRYSKANLKEWLVIKVLNSHGINLEQIKNIMKVLKDFPSSMFSPSGTIFENEEFTKENYAYLFIEVNVEGKAHFYLNVVPAELDEPVVSRADLRNHPSVLVVSLNELFERVSRL